MKGIITTFLCFTAFFITSTCLAQKGNFNNQNSIQLIVNQSFFQGPKINSSVGINTLTTEGKWNMGLAIGYVHPLPKQQFLHTEAGISFIKYTVIANFHEDVTVGDTTYKNIPDVNFGQVQAVPYLGFGFGKSLERKKVNFHLETLIRLNFFQRYRRTFGVFSINSGDTTTLFIAQQGYGYKSLLGYEVFGSLEVKFGINRNTPKRSNFQTNLIANYSFTTFFNGRYKYPLSTDGSKGNFDLRLNMVGVELVYNFRFNIHRKNK